MKESSSHKHNLSKTTADRQHEDDYPNEELLKQPRIYGQFRIN